jgi:hypothetical protein
MKRNLQRIIAVVAVFVLFGMAFYIAIPSQFESRGVLLTDEVLLLLSSLLFYFFIKQKHWIWKYAGLLIILWAFALPLLRLWETAESTWNIILGLLPWADAIGYYSDAVHLINGGLFSAFSGRRPIFASLLAVLLKLTDQNLQLALIVFVVLNSVAVFLLALEVQKEFGSIAAMISVYFSHFFYRPYVGTTLTEQLGFPAGLLAFTILLRSVRRSDRLLFAVGLLLLTFSLFVRAGAFFILPALVVFGVFFFVKKGHPVVQTIMIIMVFMLIPIILNIWLGRIVASPGAVQFGNFSYTLYGQAVGGKRWTQVLIDHPELNSLQEPELSQETYRLAFEEIINNPSGIIKGSLKAWKEFIVPSNGSLFSFLEFGNRQLDLIFQYVVTILFLVGLWLLWQDRKKPAYGFILASLLGIFISIPFLPPMDAGIRPYAATIAVIFFPVIVLTFKFSSKWDMETFARDSQFPIVEVVLGLGIIFISVFGGAYLKYISHSNTIQTASCPSDLVPVTFKVSPGAYLYLVESDSGLHTQVPVVLLKHAFRSFNDFPYGDFASLMRKINKPQFITVTPDLITGNVQWVIAPSDLVAYHGQIISACALPVSDPYPAMYIKSFETP